MLCVGGENESRKKEVLVCGSADQQQTAKAGQLATYPDLALLIDENIPLTGYPGKVISSFL